MSENSVLKYNFRKIEKKWQEKWEKDKLNQPDLDKAKKPFYNLMMFPYPSAEGLHIGGVFTFTGVDTFGRYKRMQGYDVFEPIGLDGFGIHAENYAMKIKEHIKDVSQRTEKNFYRQLSSIGNMYDWSRTVETYKPEYYKWTQWIFLQMYKKGLAYQRKAKVNWCPSCKTVLSDEQVIAGQCERCDSEVEKKELKQWFFGITKYADRLLKNLKWIDWPEDVKRNQRNWIGKSEGALIKFQIPNSKFQNSRKYKQKTKDYLEVFTTRPDTIFGATYMVIAPEHEMIKNQKARIKNYEEVAEYVNKALNKSEQERKEDEKSKTGIEIKGIKAINPATGKEIPIWVADYVLGDYGTGAIMAVPAHDERDFEFAKKYGLEIKCVVDPRDIKSGELLRLVDKDPREDPQKVIEEIYKGKRVYEWKGVSINSDFLDGLEIKEAKKKIIKWLEENKFGKKAVDYKLRDWCVSRQRYWGPPIPIVFCGSCALKEFKKQKNNILEITFRNQSIWNQILRSEKTVETRALNPEEKNRYFGDIKEGEKVIFKNKETNKEKVYEIKSARIYQNLEILFEDKKLIKKIFPKRSFKNLNDLKKAYADLAEGNLEKIEKNGLAVWEIEEYKIPVPIPEKDLPVLLPEMEDFLPEGKGKGPLAKNEKFIKTKCPKCGGDAERETDVSDPFVDSSWYFLRYPSTEFDDKIFDKKRTDKWLPVDSYIGGKEHTVLHLLYSRFVTMVLNDLGCLSFDEPYKKFIGHGLITKDGAKMSKSKGNVVNPDEMIEKYGADTTRLYLRFLGDFYQGGDWRDSGVVGMSKFVNRLWNTFYGLSGKGQGVEKLNMLDKTIKAVEEDIEKLSFNTAVARIMELVNWINENKAKFNEEQVKRVKKILALIIAPFAPHLGEEFWASLENKNPFNFSLQKREIKSNSVFDQAWPKYNPKNIIDDEIELAIQVNGKLRGVIKVNKNISKEEAIKLVKKEEKIKKFIGETEIKKEIFVPGRLVNLVV